MVPKKAKELYKVVATQLGISEDLVRDASEMYWSDVRKSLTEMKYHAIFIDGLGTFKAKEQRLREALEKYERIFNYNDGSSFRKMAMKNELGLRITRIKKLLELIEQDKIKKQLIKAKRNVKLITNMEEPDSDSRGGSELNIQEGTGGEDIREEDEDM